MGLECSSRSLAELMAKGKEAAAGQTKKEKADNLVLRYHDGTKIDTTIGGASASLVSSSQTSGLQEENKKLREAVKALAEKTDLSAVESADEIRKLVETDPRTVLREQQKELNKLKKELTKKEKIEKQIKEKTLWKVSRGPIPNTRKRSRS